MKLFAVVLALASFAPQEKKKAAEPLTLMNKRGEAIYEEPFTEESWGSKDWNKYAGTYAIEKDQLKVAEKKADNHHPAASRRITDDNLVVQVRFKFDGSGWLGIAFDEKEHVARCMIRPDGFELLKMSGTGPTTKSEKVDEKKAKFEPGAWHTLTIEIQGKEMLAQVDDTHFAWGAHDAFAQKKTRIELISGGQYAWYDELKVWKGVADERWPQKKAILAAQTRKK
jgi:hypothetical protein